jgi:hypothetical protein
MEEAERLQNTQNRIQNRCKKNEASNWPLHQWSWKRQKQVQKIESALLVIIDHRLSYHWAGTQRRENKTNIGHNHCLGHQHNQLTTASAVMEEAGRLQNTQNRIRTKRQKKNEATNWVLMEEAERGAKNRISIGHGHCVSY